MKENWLLHWNILSNTRSKWAEKGLRCPVRWLQLKCQHRSSRELADLSPLEGHLISLYQPCGWITKFQIDLDKGMHVGGRYRKCKAYGEMKPKGHPPKLRAVMAVSRNL